MAILNLCPLFSSNKLLKLISLPSMLMINKKTVPGRAACVSRSLVARPIHHPQACDETNPSSTSSDTAFCKSNNHKLYDDHWLHTDQYTGNLRQSISSVPSKQSCLRSQNACWGTHWPLRHRNSAVLHAEMGTRNVYAEISRYYISFIR